MKLDDKAMLRMWQGIFVKHGLSRLDGSSAYYPALNAAISDLFRAVRDAAYAEAAEVADSRAGKWQAIADRDGEYEAVRTAAAGHALGASICGSDIRNLIPNKQE